MNRARRSYVALWATLATILIAQGVAVSEVAPALDSWAFIRVLVAMVLSVVAAIGLGAVALRALRATRRRTPGRLAHWLRDIDLTTEQSPRPPIEPDEHDALLVSAVDDLVLRTHRYRDKLLVRHQRVQRLLRNVTDVLYHADGQGRLTWITDTVTDMLGYEPVELEGRPLHTLLANPDVDHHALINSPELLRHPTRVFRRDGTIAWLMISSRRIDDAEGQPIGSEGICRDGTRLIETQQALTKVKARAEVTLASIGDAVITTDAHGQVEYLNPRAEKMLTVASANATALHFDTLCHLVDTTRNVAVSGLVRECIDAGTTREWHDSLTLFDRNERSEGHAVKVTISPIRDSQNAIVGTVIVLHDVTRLQQISREMAYQANHDMLTGLPNRRAFENLLGRFLGEARDRSAEHALCYLDLDQFKLVNDTCGHNAGDEMLRQITAHLSAKLRANDHIARLGGDEFGIIMRNLSLADAQNKAETLRAEIDAFRFRWEDNLFRLGVSIGVAAFDRHAVSANELLRRADTACYLAKEKGRNQVHVYRGDSDETQTRHGDLQRMQEISDALDNNRFVLFAQTIRPLDFQPGMRVGVELLLRMLGADDKIISPQSFLITAERYNIVSRIDRWVLSQALELIAAAGDGHGVVDHYSINISAQSIADEHFVGYARELIESSAVDPKRLVFEITETTAVTNVRRAGELMRSLCALGCRFSLDDFGSGLSSFSYLKNLPSDFIKIDGKLVRNILHDRVGMSIVESINQVGQAMGLKTVAEHVESRALLDALRKIGVDYVQGYHIARPLPFEQLGESLHPVVHPIRGGIRPL